MYIAKSVRIGTCSYNMKCFWNFIFQESSLVCQEILFMFEQFWAKSQQINFSSPQDCNQRIVEMLHRLHKTRSRSLLFRSECLDGQGRDVMKNECSYVWSETESQGRQHYKQMWCRLEKEITYINIYLILGDYNTLLH